MILEFCVGNYLSIKDEMKISFVATSLKESLPDANDLVPIPGTGVSLVRSAVIYGANASGKTNVLKAVAFYKHFIMDSFKNSQAGESIDVENFRLNAATVNEPTTMEATFTDGTYIYRYGFDVDSKSVHSEWLYRRVNKKRAKEVEVFYREDGSTTVHPKSPLIQDLANKKWCVATPFCSPRPPSSMTPRRSISCTGWAIHRSCSVARTKIMGTGHQAP